jgi:hypothetical protein
MASEDSVEMGLTVREPASRAASLDEVGLARADRRNAARAGTEKSADQD